MDPRFNGSMGHSHLRHAEGALLAGSLGAARRETDTVVARGARRRARSRGSCAQQRPSAAVAASTRPRAADSGTTQRRTTLPGLLQAPTPQGRDRTRRPELQAMNLSWTDPGTGTGDGGRGTVTADVCGLRAAGGNVASAFLLCGLAAIRQRPRRPVSSGQWPAVPSPPFRLSCILHPAVCRLRLGPSSRPDWTLSSCLLPPDRPDRRGRDAPGGRLPAPALDWPGVPGTSVRPAASPRPQCRSVQSPACAGPCGLRPSAAEGAEGRRRRPPGLNRFRTATRPPRPGPAGPAHGGGVAAYRARRPAPGSGAPDRRGVPGSLRSGAPRHAATQSAPPAPRNVRDRRGRHGWRAAAGQTEPRRGQRLRPGESERALARAASACKLAARRSRRRRSAQ